MITIIDFIEFITDQFKDKHKYTYKHKYIYISISITIIISIIMSVDNNKLLTCSSVVTAFKNKLLTCSSVVTAFKFEKYYIAFYITIITHATGSININTTDLTIRWLLTGPIKDDRWIIERHRAIPILKNVKLKLKNFFDSEEIGKYRINLPILYNFSYRYKKSSQ